jgi:hypothetical protein
MMDLCSCLGAVMRKDLSTLLGFYDHRLFNDGYRLTAVAPGQGYRSGVALNTPIGIATHCPH